MYGVKSDRSRFILPGVLPRTLYSHNKVVKMNIKCYILRKLIRDSVPNFFFIEVTFCITNTYISNSPKTFFSPNYIVCLSSLNTVCPVFCSGNCRESSWNPSFPVLVTDHICSWGHTLRAAFLTQPCYFLTATDWLCLCVYLTVRLSGYWCTTQMETLGNQKEILLYCLFMFFLSKAWKCCPLNSLHVRPKTQIPDEHCNSANSSDEH